MTYDVRVEYIVLPLGSDDEVISGFFKVDKLINASNAKIANYYASKPASTICFKTQLKLEYDLIMMLVENKCIFRSNLAL